MRAFFNLIVECVLIALVVLAVCWSLRLRLMPDAVIAGILVFSFGRSLYRRVLAKGGAK